MARQRWLLGLIISLTAAALFLLLNPILKSGTSPFRLGLDLQGGSQITLQVKPSDTIKDISSPEGQKAVGDVERVIADRVNRLGVSEPLVQRVGNDKILVQLAGIKDPYEAESLLGRAAQLEFREQKAGTEDKFQALFNQYRPLINQEAALRKQIKELKKSEDRAALAALSVEIKKVSQKSFTDLFNKTGIDGRNLK
jgi:preprotein translocase subunit SecD